MTVRRKAIGVMVADMPKIRPAPSITRAKKRGCFDSRGEVMRRM